MIRNKVLTHILIPAAAVVTIDKSKHNRNDECLRKPSELPIYTADPKPKREICVPREPGTLEQSVGKIRQSIYSVTEQIASTKNLAQGYIQEGLENAECLIEYLQEEDNTTPKYGAVAVGALTGFILGLRGKFFRRTLYASAGALSMAALCYPKEASQYSQSLIAEAKHYTTIAYNFIYGVKKDDPPLELPSLPKFPTSVSEAWDTAKNLGKSSNSTVAEPQPEKVRTAQVVELTDIIAEVDEECQCPFGSCMTDHDESPSQERN